MTYRYRTTDTKTHRHRKTWIVPDDQVREFLSGPIDYKKLIEDCLKQYVVAAIDKSKKKKKSLITTDD